MLQQYRRYATEPTPGGSSNTLVYAAVAAAAAGGSYFYFNQKGSADIKSGLQKAEDKITGPAKEALTGGDQGWVSLRLAKVENVNHNTKKFFFELPGEDYVSGLKIASAILTKYKGPEMEKPVIRPYTPVSDEGEPP